MTLSNARTIRAKMNLSAVLESLLNAINDDIMKNEQEEFEIHYRFDRAADDENIMIDTSSIIEGS